MVCAHPCSTMKLRPFKGILWLWKHSIYGRLLSFGGPRTSEVKRLPGLGESLTVCDSAHSSSFFTGQKSSSKNSRRLFARWCFALMGRNVAKKVMESWTGCWLGVLQVEWYAVHATAVTCSGCESFEQWPVDPSYVLCIGDNTTQPYRDPLSGFRWTNPYNVVPWGFERCSYADG